MALSEAITGFRVEELPGSRGDVSAVWFQADQLYLISVDILGLAFKFEVFTLTVKTPAEMLGIIQVNAPQMEKVWAEMREAGLPIPPMGPPVEPAPAGELAKWPFQSWRLDVLERMEFIVGPEHLPEAGDSVEEYLQSLPAGVAPDGSEHTCLTAIGLLFTSDDGGRFLVVADGMPGWMRVSNEEEVVQSYLRQSIVVPAAEYATALKS
ncbi:hypothetical protein [Sphingosinicella sp. YJ22]|uniref:hypothetical protein n=1 Tax=Sphingosinicella sp. YJ22 TaxID=1104780 RepID=UPI001407A3CD|nr:hypothetical protein [Sphingosinicella sp. YJ22]